MNDKENKARRDNQNLATKNMDDSYIRKLLCKGLPLRAADIPQEFIEAKRAHLKLTRLIKEMSN